jgi:hypothetical protein
MSASIMELVHSVPESKENSIMPDRRESEQPARWADPRIILGVIQLFVGVAGLAVVVFGGLIGIYVMMQTRSATSEMSNAQLSQQITLLGSKVDKMTDAVSASTAESAQLKSNVETLKRDLEREAEDRKARDGWLEARIVSNK